MMNDVIDCLTLDGNRARIRKLALSLARGGKRRKAQGAKPETAREVAWKLIPRA
jgi:hypothetical protein